MHVYTVWDLHYLNRISTLEKVSSGMLQGGFLLITATVYSATTVTVDDLKWLYASLKERRKQFKLNTFYRIV